MCFDSLNSSDIACGEYASRTLAGKQAPSMAKTTAIDSKQCRRAKPEGSPTLLCALGSRFWGENPDERRFLHLIRISGEISRTSVAPPYTLTRLLSKSERGVSKNKLKHRFGIPLGNKTGKMRSRCFRAGWNQSVLRYAIPISTSQGRRAFRSRSPALA